MRDAHQSLLATRVRSHDLLQDRPGHGAPRRRALLPGVWGGATFDVSMRFLKEDPWTRLHRLREAIPNILFQMLLRGSNAVGYTNYPDNVVERFVEEAADERRRRLPRLRLAQLDQGHDGGHGGGAHGAARSARPPSATPATSPIRGGTSTRSTTTCQLARELERMGAHILAIKDMAGLLKPMAAYKLVKALKEEVGIPVHLHTHDTSGVAAATLLEAAEAGVDVVDAALSSLSGLTAQPNLNALVAALAGSERDPRLDRAGPAAAGQLLGDGARVLRALRVGAEAAAPPRSTATRSRAASTPTTSRRWPGSASSTAGRSARRCTTR